MSKNARHNSLPSAKAAQKRYRQEHPTLHIRLATGEKELVQAAAERENASINEFCRQAILQRTNL